MRAAYVIGTAAINFGLVILAASIRHSALIAECLHTTVYNAIGRAAANISMPDLTAIDTDDGRGVYRTESGVCHSGPGLSDPPFGQVLNAPAPDAGASRSSGAEPSSTGSSSTGSA